MPERQVGTVAKWLNHKGIGFITPDGEKEGENDVLVHYQQIKQASDDGFKSLEQGAKIEFDLEKDPKNPEKNIAVNVTGIHGEDCPARKKGKGKGKKGKGKRKSKGKGKGKDEEEEEEECQ